MNKLIRFSKTILIDTLGVLCIIAAVLTGWLPGPGGIPLFLIGLSLLAINHTWARKHMDTLKNYADRLSDQIFIADPTVQLLYDIFGPILMIVGSYLVWRHSAMWLVSVGIVLFFMGVTILSGNRQRWPRLKATLKRKH